MTNHLVTVKLVKTTASPYQPNRAGWWSLPGSRLGHEKERFMNTELEHSVIESNGIKLHAVQAGPVDGPLVILLHGFPEFWYGWRKQIGPLAEAGFRVLVPDQRGYNLSEKPKGVRAYSLDELTRDVIGLLDAAGQRQCCLAGHDWGAAVAWETALRYPERVSRLAILNVPHLDVMARTVRSSRQQLRKSWYIFYFQIPGLPEWALRANDYNNLRRMLRLSGRRSTFSDANIEEYVQAWRQPGALTAMINWYRAVFRQAARGPWDPAKIPQRRVKVPTLMLWGRHDVALSSAMAQPSIDLCDQGRLVFFDKATHWVQHDEAEAVTRELLGFFKQD
jgi:pimeloyl-ACP methyl ester carboxylesterase